MKNVSATVILLITLNLCFWITEGQAAAIGENQTVSSDSFYLQRIKIEGNTRIEKDTILSQVDLEVGKRYSYEELDQALKKLYNSGFFEDAALGFEQTTLIIKVKENPIVDQVQIEGNDNLADDILKSEMQLRPRRTYTLARLRADTQRIQDIYRLKGHFSAIVTPEIIKKSQNRVSVVFKVKEGDPTVVRQIFFIGNKNFDHGKLEGVIHTKETRWYRFFTSEDNYDPDRLAYDRELLRKFYLEHGYADFQIKSAVAELTPDQKEFFITFTLQEGERYKIGKIDLTTTLKKIDLNALRKVLTFTSGDWYSSKDIEKTVMALSDVLGNMGYAFVDIQPIIMKNENDRKLDITFNVQEGPRVYINKIRILRNERTDDEVIRREIRFDEGDAFNTNILKDSEKRIKDLGFFKKLTVQKNPGSAPDLIDIDYTVEEEPTGELSAGAGYSSTDGPLIDFRGAEHNFRGKGQDVRAGVTLSKRRQEYDIGFTEPYFLGRELAAGFDVFRVDRKRYQDTSFDQKIMGVSFNLGYQISEYISQGWGYRIQTDKISHTRNNASVYVREQVGNKLLSALSHDISYDRRDSRVNPTQGYILSLSNDLAGLGGNISYLKNQISGSYYYPLMEDTVVSVWGRAGYMFGLLGRKTRIADRYVLGAESLRGFESGGVTPRDTRTEDALGGEKFYATGVESIFPVGLPAEFNVKGAAFAEAGSVWGSRFKGPNIFDKPTLRASVGFGIRWKSPMGPLKIDIARPIVKAKSDQTQFILFGFSSRF